MEEGKEGSPDPQRDLILKIREIRRDEDDPVRREKLVDEAMEQSGLYRREEDGGLVRIDDEDDEE
jgi:hypothetical protein